MKNGVLFDLDGTLIQGTEAVKKAAFFGLIKDYGNDELIAWVGNEENQQTIYDSGSTTKARLSGFKNETIKKAFQEYYTKLKDQRYIELIESGQFTIELYPEAERVVRELKEKKTKIGIVTDSTTEQVNAILKKLPILRELFGKNIITQSNVNNRKPDPESINVMMSNLGLKPQETTYIGDGVGDLKAAVSAGVKRIIHINHPGDPRTSLPPETDLWRETGRFAQAKSLDLFGKRQPTLIIMRAKPCTGKGYLCRELQSNVKGPLAVVNKDMVAHIYGLNRKNPETPYPKNRKLVYQLFQKYAEMALREYGAAVLDAPFTKQADVEKMVEILKQKIPELKVIVVTVDAPMGHRERRKESRIQQGAFFGYMDHEEDLNNPGYEENMENTGNLVNAKLLKISNPDGSNVAETLAPLYEVLKS